MWAIRNSLMLALIIWMWHSWMQKAKKLSQHFCVAHSGSSVACSLAWFFTWLCSTNMLSWGVIWPGSATNSTQSASRPASTQPWHKTSSVPRVPSCKGIDEGLERHWQVIDVIDVIVNGSDWSCSNWTASCREALHGSPLMPCQPGPGRSASSRCSSLRKKR